MSACPLCKGERSIEAGDEDHSRICPACHIVKNLNEKGAMESGENATKVFGIEMLGKTLRLKEYPAYWHILDKRKKVTLENFEIVIDDGQGDGGQGYDADEFNSNYFFTRSEAIASLLHDLSHAANPEE